MYFQFHLKRGDLQGLAYNKQRLEATVIAILCCINKTDIWQTFRDHLDHIAAPCSTETVANRESACLLQWKRQTKRSKVWSHYIKIVFWIVITINSTNLKQVFQMHSYGIQTIRRVYRFCLHFASLSLCCLAGRSSLRALDLGTRTCDDCHHLMIRPDLSVTI